MIADFRLKVFLAVASERSFSRAAQLLGISQPAVSQKISSLEAEFGTSLFERAHGSVELTGKGHALLPFAKRITALSDAAAAALASGPEGVSPSEPDILPLMKEFIRFVENFEGKGYIREVLEECEEGPQEAADLQ